jgi:hypothetical protein
MTRALAIAGIAALGLALGGCTTTAPSVTSARSARAPGKVLKMINNTAGTVTMKSCPAGEPQHCSAAARIAPGHSADFPLSPATPGSAPALLWITGYGTKPVCFIVPDTREPRSPSARVTDAQSDDCVYQFLAP